MTIADPTSRLSAVAEAAIENAFEAGHSFVIPFICLGEFWRVITEPRGLAVSTPEAREMLDRWLAVAPLVGGNAAFVSLLEDLIASLEPVGAAIFDCEIVAICIENEVDEIWTFDSDFPRDPRLAVRVLASAPE